MKHFDNYDDLLESIFAAMQGRMDLVPLTHQIRYALKKDVRNWSLDMGYKGVDFPVCENDEEYTFQIIVENENGEDYQNITVYERKDGVGGYKSEHGEGRLK